LPEKYFPEFGEVSAPLPLPVSYAYAWVGQQCTLSLLSFPSLSLSPFRIKTLFLNAAAERRRLAERVWAEPDSQTGIDAVYKPKSEYFSHL